MNGDGSRHLQDRQAVRPSVCRSSVEADKRQQKSREAVFIRRGTGISDLFH